MTGRLSPSADPSLRQVGVPVATVWRSPDAPRDVDEAAVRAVPDAAAWADAMDKEVRAGLHGRTETQLLMGEPVRVVEERGDWTRVVALGQASSSDGSGYPGWVRTAHLHPPVPARPGAAATVVTRSATCSVDGAEVELSFGTVLPVGSVEEECATLHLPGGRTGTVALDAVRLSHERQQPVYGHDDVLAAAAQFLGLRYLWGGTSCYGLDCSGLVHLTFRAFGVLLPRDAHDQAAYVDPVPLDDVRPGDLYFFARPGEAVYHVGFVTRSVAPDGTRWMLHAPEGGELIEDAPLAPHRTETLVSAGRVRKPRTGQLPRYEGAEA
jgi:gamma-D-glutamyl-L-lysine dipeptidyl-peptidase